MNANHLSKHDLALAFSMAMGKTRDISNAQEHMVSASDKSIEENFNDNLQH